jgi:hypothetical protein
VTFFGVAWKASEDECREYVARFDVPYGNALDEDEDVFEAFSVPYQPATVLITARGRIFHRFAGPVEARELAATLREMIEL